MRNYYRGDPYWMAARRAGTCAGCGEPFPKGAEVFRFKSGKLFAKKCGCGTYESERFNELAQAEYAYGGGY